MPNFVKIVWYYQVLPFHQLQLPKDLQLNEKKWNHTGNQKKRLKRIILKATNKSNLTLKRSGLFYWFKQKKCFLWAMAEADKNHGFELGMIWYFQWNVYTSFNQFQPDDIYTNFNLNPQVSSNSNISLSIIIVLRITRRYVSRNVD